MAQDETARVGQPQNNDSSDDAAKRFSYRSDGYTAEVTSTLGTVRALLFDEDEVEEVEDWKERVGNLGRKSSSGSTSTAPSQAS